MEFFSFKTFIGQTYCLNLRTKQAEIISQTCQNYYNLLNLKSYQTGADV